MLTRIKLLIDDKPESMLRVIGGLRRTGFVLENHRMARASRDGCYQVGLKLRGEPLPLADVESYLRSVEGVVEVSKLRATPYDEISYRRNSAQVVRPLVPVVSIGVFTELLSDQLLEDLCESFADTGDRDHARALVEHLVASYPQTANAVAKIEANLRRNNDRNTIVRNLGVRVGRRIGSTDRRAAKVRDPATLLDRLLVGYLFPFARSYVVEPHRRRLTDGAMVRLVVDESNFVYRRGRTLRLGVRRDPCLFIEGLIQGVLDHSPSGDGIEVEETSCMARGARTCVFQCRATA